MAHDVGRVLGLENLNLSARLWNIQGGVCLLTLTPLFKESHTQTSLRKVGSFFEMWSHCRSRLCTSEGTQKPGVISWEDPSEDPLHTWFPFICFLEFFS